MGICDDMIWNDMWWYVVIWWDLKGFDGFLHRASTCFKKNPKTYSPSFYRSAKYIYIFFYSTLTKVTIRRFTSMLVAMGGVNCKFVFFGSEPFFFGASSFCHEFPGNPGHLLINVEILINFEFFKIKLGMPPFFNNQRLERITYIEICYLK